MKMPVGYCHQLLTLALMTWLATLSGSLLAQNYDIAIINGRVIDPETGLDAKRNVGIKDGQIVELSQRSMTAAETIDATGLVVAPGFIDLHVHGISNVEQEYQVRDGVTTALELEMGMPFIDRWLEQRRGTAIINYGASAYWPFARYQTMPGTSQGVARLEEKSQAGNLNFRESMGVIRKSLSIPLTSERTAEMLMYLRTSLKNGALGIGVPVGYLTGASNEEVYRIYQLAAELDVPIFSHVRQGGLIAIQQAMADAMSSGASLHIVHLNSMALDEIRLAIEMINSARARGHDITTEMYPYTAGSTRLESAIFNEGWQEIVGADYEDLQWIATGERLTQETFQKYRAQGGTVIIHNMRPEWIASGMPTEGTIIASDGMPYAKLAHPRTAGTFSRVLGKYVREEAVLTLAQAIEKMTLLPARRLEAFAPAMRKKGRIQNGMDADVTIFDAATIIDHATFEDGLQYSTGVQYVVIDGQMVVRNGQLVSNVFAGKAITSEVD